MEELLSKLCQFVGYGSENAKVIFIGIEEKTDDDKYAKSYEKRLAIQSKLKPFTDLQELCDQLDGLYNPQTSGPQPQPTWSPLCSVMLGINGDSQMGDMHAIKQYQKEKLGRIPGDSLLAELLPVPKSGAGVFDDLHSRLLGVPRVDPIPPVETYRTKVLPERQKRLAKMLTERFANFPPRLIVAYGRLWRDGRPWGQFEYLFDEAVGQMKYTKDLNDRIQWAKKKECLFVMTYHPAYQDGRKFDLVVARRIVEIYKNYQKEIGR